MSTLSKLRARLRSKYESWFHSFAQGSKIVYLQESLRQSQIANDYLMSLWLQGRQPHPNPLLKHGQKFFSQSDEDGILLEILRRLDVSSGVSVEIGCGNGLENNTLNLLARGWRTVWIDAAGIAFDRNCNPRLLSYQQQFVTAENVVNLVREGQKRLGVDRVDVLSIDVDGNDGYLASAMLEAGFLPSVVVIETNEVIPPPIRFAQPYNPGHVWDRTKNYGWSLQSLADLFSRHSYVCVACNLQTGVNAFFVRERFMDRFSDVPSNLADLYVGRSIHPLKYRDRVTQVDANLIEAVVRAASPTSGAADSLQG